VIPWRFFETKTYQVGDPFKRDLNPLGKRQDIVELPYPACLYADGAAHGLVKCAPRSSIYHIQKTPPETVPAFEYERSVPAGIDPLQRRDARPPPVPWFGTVDPEPPTDGLPSVSEGTLPFGETGPGIYKRQSDPPPVGLTPDPDAPPTKMPPNWWKFPKWWDLFKYGNPFSYKPFDYPVNTFDYGPIDGPVGGSLDGPLISSAVTAGIHKRQSDPPPTGLTPDPNAPPLKIPPDWWNRFKYPRPFDYKTFEYGPVKPFKYGPVNPFDYGPTIDGPGGPLEGPQVNPGVEQVGGGGA
jgi:hypothetical protein